MGSDWIPRPEAEFNAAAVAFNAWAQANGAAQGLTAAQLSELAAACSDWSGAVAASQAAQAAADAAVQAKEGQRARLEPLLRRLGAMLRESSLMSDADRVAAGLGARKRTRTRVAAPATRPFLMVDTSKRLEHTLHFKDESMPSARRKPPGVRGVEVWRFVGMEAPSGPAECSFVDLATRTPFRVAYNGSHANKMAHYLLRWVSTRGEKGPWSETVSATIGG